MKNRDWQGRPWVVMGLERPSSDGGDGDGRSLRDATRAYLQLYGQGATFDRNEMRMLRQPYPLSDDGLSSLLAAMRNEGWVLETLGRSGRIHIVALPDPAANYFVPPPFF